MTSNVTVGDNSLRWSYDAGQHRSAARWNFAAHTRGMHHSFMHAEAATGSSLEREQRGGAPEPERSDPSSFTGETRPIVRQASRRFPPRASSDVEN